MAIVEYAELAALTGSIGPDFKRSYQRVFEVFSDDPLDGPVTVSAAPGIAIGNTYAYGHDEDLGSFAQQIDARLEERGQNFVKWTVTVQYGGVDPTQAGEATANPLDKPAEVRWGAVQWERVVDEDIQGNPIRNTAGDPFDPPVVIDDSRPVLQITRNEATFDPGLSYSYKDKVNSEPWYGGAAKTWKVASIVAKREPHGELGFFYVVDYEFHYRPETWTKRILNRGMSQIVGSKKKPIFHDNTPISQPVPLSQAGLELNFDEAVVFLKFEVFYSTAFSVFNLE